MKSDAQVIREATEVVRNQWCAGAWWDDVHDRYCAIGAIEKAMGLTLFNDANDMLSDGEITVKQYEQIRRIADRLTKVIFEQYPDIAQEFKNRGWSFNPHTMPIATVEGFNDTHTRDEMLAIFEKVGRDEI